MPVSWNFILFPLMLWVAWALVPLLDMERKSLRIRRFIPLIYVLPLGVVVLAHGMFWLLETTTGSLWAGYQQARLIECRAEVLKEWYLCPMAPDVNGGLVKLETVAESGYPQRCMRWESA